MSLGTLESLRAEIAAAHKAVGCMAVAVGTRTQDATGQWVQDGPLRTLTLVERITELNAAWQRDFDRAEAADARATAAEAQFMSIAEEMITVAGKLETAEQERDELKAERNVVTCLFCDERRERGDGPDALRDLWDWIKAHAMSCPQHPAVQALAAAEQREAEQSKALKAIDALAFQMTAIMHPDYTHPNVGAIRAHVQAALASPSTPSPAPSAEKEQL